MKISREELLAQVPTTGHVDASYCRGIVDYLRFRLKIPYHRISPSHVRKIADRGMEVSVVNLKARGLKVDF